MTLPSRNSQPGRQAAPARVPEDARRTPAGRSGSGPLFDEPTVLEPAPEPQPAPAERPPVTMRIAAVFDGFTVEVECIGRIEQLPATIRRIRELGGVPAVVASPAAVAAEAEREAPICPYHGPMKPSTKRLGTWYCPAKMGDGTYCREKHPKE